MQWIPLILCCPTWMVAASLLKQTSTPELNLYVHLLSDELACNFNNFTFCGLVNNGGWTFKRSQLEAVQRLSGVSAQAPETPPPPSPTNHFVCADWGVLAGSKGSWSLVHTPSTDGEDEQQQQQQRAATLEVFLLPPVHRHVRQTSGKVFYVGPVPTVPRDPLKRTSEDNDGDGDGTDDVYKETRRQEEVSGLCLELDVRLSAQRDVNGGSSKLTIQFRSLTQTIEVSPPPASQSMAPPSTPSLSQTLAFLVRLVLRILLKPSATPSQAHRQVRQNGIPAGEWLHVSIPIDHYLLSTSQPDSPFYFALNGELGVCIDALAFSMCHGQAALHPSLSWTPNNSIDLSPTPAVLFREPGVVETFGEFFWANSFFTGAFLFACLLAILVAVLIIVFVVSIACGKGKSCDPGRGRCHVNSLHITTATEAALLRSPSISSLPGAAVHQRPVEELLRHVKEEQEEEEKKHFWRLQTDHTSLDRRRRSDKRARRATSVVDRLHCRRAFSNGDFNAVTVPPRKRTKRSPAVAGSLGLSNAAQRVSLLLSINEDNELVLVPQTSINRISSLPPPGANLHVWTTTATESTPTSTNASPESSNTTTTTMATTSSHSETTTTPSASSSFVSTRLSKAEAEATLQEMAASVVHLGNTTNHPSSDSRCPSKALSEGLSPLYEEVVRLLN